MFVRIVIVASTALFLAMLAGAGPATAQEIPAEKSVEEMLAYTPTGDALWDRYAQALLTSLPAAELDLSWVGISAPLLPDELLADWEADFADDPRYWQLRSWNATQTDLWLRSNPDFNPLTMFEYMFKGEDEIPRRGEYKGPSSHSFLERAIELGVADALIWMQYHSDWAYTYRDLQRRFESDELTEEERAELPQLENPDDVLAWLVENELAEYGKMIEHCPGDSWPYYQRASRNFHFDRWDDGMADLRAGNQAEHNRLPLFFPMSFLVDALSNEQDCGSEIVAGWIDPYGVEIRLPNSVGIKQSWRKQQELLEPGPRLPTCQYAESGQITSAEA